MARLITKPLGTQDAGLPLGGPGSGNWGHAGRKGKRGGSLPRSSAVSIKSGRDWTDRYKDASGRVHPEADQWKVKEKPPYFTGDPRTATMQEIWDGSSDVVKDLAKKTGVIALDADTYDYVGKLMEQGHFRGVEANLAANPTEIAGVNIDKVGDLLRADKAAHIALQEAGRDALNDRDMEGYAKKLLEVTDRFNASRGGNVDWYDADQTGVYASVRNDIRRVIEARDDPSRVYDLVEGMGKWQRSYVTTALHDLISASTLNEASIKAGKEGLFTALDVGGANVATMAKRGDSFVLRVSSDAGAQVFKRAAGRLAIETEMGPKYMMALRKASPDDERAQAAQFRNTWDSSVHTFSGSVNGVYEVIPQESVRAAYDKRLKSVDNVMESTYHGTHYSAAQSISSGGFRVPKSTKAGRMMGNGVYLANKSSKSAQYIDTSFHRGRARGVLIVSNAARGKQVDWGGIYRTPTGGQTVFGKTGTPISSYRRLQNDEWCVKNPASVLPRFWVDMNRY